MACEARSGLKSLEMPFLLTLSDVGMTCEARSGLQQRIAKWKTFFAKRRNGL
jgi:hypothetical protein